MAAADAQRAAPPWRTKCLEMIAPRNERPVRGDNRTGQAIWALGVDGRSRRIQPRWGGITAPTLYWSRQGRRTFKAPANFFNFLAGFRRRIYGAAWIGVMPAAGFAGGRLIGRRLRTPWQPQARASAWIASLPVQSLFAQRRLPTPRPPASPARDDRGDRRKGIGFAGAEQIVAAGRAEIARGFHQDRAHFVRLQRRIALQHQRRKAADIGRGKRGARRHLVFFVGRRQEDVDAGRGDARYSCRGSRPRTACPGHRWR